MLKDLKIIDQLPFHKGTKNKLKFHKSMNFVHNQWEIVS